MAHNWELMHIYIKCQTKDCLTVCHIRMMGVNHIDVTVFKRQNL